MFFKHFFPLIWSITTLSQTSQRQTHFFDLVDDSSQAIKLSIKHVFDLGQDENTAKYSGRSNLRVWDDPIFPKDSEKLDSLDENTTELDFDILNQLIDTKGKLAMGPPSNDVLKARHAILNLARMAGHAYKRLPSSPWRDMDPGWHVNSTFGWKKRAVRGYVFSDKSNANLVIAFKGTTFSFLPGGGDATGPSDRESDNLMFSCCCGATNGNWHQVCSCGRENNVCSQKCLIEHARANTTYFHGAKLIYEYVLRKYKDANIVLVGHSLGGALASLVGHETGKSAVTFEAPGDRLYAERLGLDFSGNNSKNRVLHYGHNADPIFMGTCTGKLSLCYIGGYGMDSKCHTSTKCMFDAIGGLGWSQSILHHRSTASIRLYQLWAYNMINIDAKCSSNPECKDCLDWKFIDRW